MYDRRESAHPRSRGENGLFTPRVHEALGSSPLTRGKRRLPGGLVGLVGLIPAHAGKTKSRCLRRIWATAHPRSRGENVLRVAHLSPPSGSSPLTRGKQKHLIERVLPLRLIPAHAGKTCVRRRAAWPTTAHPRSRGENDPSHRSHPAGAGSSPLTRGKRQDADRLSRAPGLIPAHAGKTASASGTATRVPAHPRSRGENAFLRRLVVCRRGSSPLTRGKPERGHRPTERRRLIPAHAGKTSRSRTGRCFCPAHPRSRGENVPARDLHPGVCGSSPLTRGKLDRVGAQVYNDGLIPAHAGKTLHQSRADWAA